MKSRLKSFVYAWNGIRYAFRTQPNFRIHLVATVLVNIAAVYFNVGVTAWIAIWICIGMVLAAELFNTAIELLCDELWKERRPGAGHIKDLAAAAVFVSALISLFTAGFIFIPRISSLFN